MFVLLLLVLEDLSLSLGGHLSAVPCLYHVRVHIIMISVTQVLLYLWPFCCVHTTEYTFDAKAGVFVMYLGI